MKILSTLYYASDYHSLIIETPLPIIMLKVRIQYKQLLYKNKDHNWAVAHHS